MSRNMSFMLTTGNIRNRTKTVTRRLGWWFLKPGDILNAVEKCQGLKKGERIKRICEIQVISSWPEKLNSISESDCIKEGFSDFTVSEFVVFFCKHNKCKPDVQVNRICFRYLKPTNLKGDEK